MVQSIIQDIARQLVTINAAWLSEVRTIGYVVRDPDIVITDFENEIGLTDRSKNSGYIRFRQDINFNREDIPARNSCGIQSSRYTHYLRLVIAAKTTTPEDLSMLLATQLNSMALTFTGIDNIKVRVLSGGSNSISITKGEASKDQLNSEYRAVYVDFNLQLDWRNDCDQIQITMACDNCTSTYDLGCVQHCEDIVISATIAEAGTATLNTNFNGVLVTQSFEVEVGDEITVPMSGLNENYEYSIQILNSSGEVIELTFGDATYDCFTVKLMP